MFEFTDCFDLISSREISLEIIEKRQGNKDILPFYWWNILIDGKPVGKVSLRIGDARSAVNYFFNGSVGYEVDEPFRGNNYAEKAVRLLFPIARAHGMTELILSCNESNTASYKTIENLGGKLLGIYETPREYFAWFEDMECKRVYSLGVEE